MKLTVCKKIRSGLFKNVIYKMCLEIKEFLALNSLQCLIKIKPNSEASILGIMEYSFIAITPMSTLTQSGSTCKSSIYGLNRSVLKLLVLDKNTWNHN